MRFITVLKSKIHKATVTDANLNYEGSITIDRDLIEAAQLRVGEKVQIVNNNNGERFETYVIEGKRGSGTICLNGAAARKVQIGDIIIIIAYTMIEVEDHLEPVLVYPNKENKLVGDPVVGSEREYVN